MRQNVDQKYRV